MLNALAYRMEDEPEKPNLEFSGQERVALEKLIELKGLKNIFASPCVCANDIEQTRMYPDLYISRYGNLNPELLLQTLEKVAEGFPTNTDLTFRYVAHDRSRFITDQILADAQIYGGKNPEASIDAICVDDGRKIEDYLRMYKAQNVVIFVYDSSKLRRIDSSSLDLYGMKPIEGLELKDTMLGTLVLEADNSELTKMLEDIGKIA